MSEYRAKTVSDDVSSGKMGYQPIMEEGVFRFDCSGNDRSAAHPSLSFTNPKVRDTPLMVHIVPIYVPNFECVDGQQIISIELPTGTSLYGTGEVKLQVFTWNTDAWGYGSGTTSLHQSHPWVLAVLPNGEALGVLADATQHCEIDLRKDSTIKIKALAPYPVITFGPFASPTAVLQTLSHAIGTIFMPPKWSLGYHQCRWSYDSDSRVLEVREVWPGPCVFPDCTQEKTRLWWAGLVKDFVANGVDGIWNDMNEPAVFKTVTKTMPESNIHRGDAEVGGHQNHSHYHNVYGMLMARSTFEGMKLGNEKKRPFVLTRAGFIGSQRYAATWTGDNLANWEHLHMSVSMVLQLSLSGQPLSGPDIGGFAGDATPKLYGRWAGVGSMFPFCRGHSEKGTTDHEPWSFGKECEEVCRVALLRRYRFIHHIYTLFYLSHTKGIPVAAPTFFADPKDPKLRSIENSFLLGPLLVHASTSRDQGSDGLLHVLPKGIWLSFDFDDSHPDLPTLYLQGGTMIPVGPPVQHVDEASATDDLSLIVALDQHGKAEGVLYEDEGDGYEFSEGGYLLTYYAAELQSSVVTIKVSKAEGSWTRPKRHLHVQLLLGGGAMVDAWGIDGEVLQIKMPSDPEISNLIAISQEQYKNRVECAKQIPDVEEVSGRKGVELSKTPVELKSADWALKIVPWIGGRMISMQHLPSGTQWLHSRVEVDGYEEYSGVEYRSAGCSEEYTVTERTVGLAGEEEESLSLEGNIGGGLVIERQISIPKTDPKVIQIDSGIISRNVGAGSGGFSRLVCFRVHPVFTLLHPTEVFVSFVSIDGSKHELWPESDEKLFEGDLRPNGEWILFDKCLGFGLVNRFNVDEVYKCMVHWGTGTVNLELWSEERPVSKESPLKISHQYEVRPIS
ncbi:hypothetical protein C5167_032891 [Papaver somniferum]|uniref:Uncharacterized protein n=1 Tax=Papaver somniferum TaxID=3469 RepID=A0A4Y7K858_PAPSO|nr:hypothetical protein C5167_032891 [Papaver somniferum]